MCNPVLCKIIIPIIISIWWSCTYVYCGNVLFGTYIREMSRVLNRFTQVSLTQEKNKNHRFTNCIYLSCCVGGKWTMNNDVYELFSGRLSFNSCYWLWKEDILISVPLEQKNFCFMLTSFPKFKDLVSICDN